eukprot:1158928-Pelagomonas_calceolata.AAC.3
MAECEGKEGKQAVSAAILAQPSKIRASTLRAFAGGSEDQLECSKENKQEALQLWPINLKSERAHQSPSLERRPVAIQQRNSARSFGLVILIQSKRTSFCWR